MPASKTPRKRRKNSMDAHFSTFVGPIQLLEERGFYKLWQPFRHIFRRLLPANGRCGWFMAGFSRPGLVSSRVSVITKAQYERMAELRYSLRKFFRFSEEAAISAGTTPHQYQALLAIKGFPGRDRITIGELAEQLQIRHHSAVGLANRLVSEGYAKRIAGTDDRRQVFLGLTRRGESVLLKLARMHQQQWREIAVHLESLLARIREPNLEHPGKRAAKRARR
jgi:DNA-binding MarR family transcriptional regulator